MNGNGWAGYPPVVPHWRAHWPAPLVDRMRTTIRKIQSDERDTAWIARELGDVPYRTMQLTCHDNPQSWAPILQGRDA